MEQKLIDYNNIDAHNFIKQLMLKEEQLTIGFFSENTQYLPCAWVETKTIKAFKYIISQNNFDWLIGYLAYGKYDIEDIDAKPIFTAEEAEHIENFQLYALKMFIESKAPIQFTPLFLDKSAYITAIASYNYGKVMFRVKRTRELMRYIREHNFAI